MKKKRIKGDNKIRIRIPTAKGNQVHKDNSKYSRKRKHKGEQDDLRNR